MSKRYMDWTDWAGDNPELAEAELRAERERAEASFARVIRAGLLQSAAQYALSEDELVASEAKEKVIFDYFEEEDEPCEHEDIDNQGVCTNCGDEVEGWEPDEAQLDQHYGTDVAA